MRRIRAGLKAFGHEIRLLTADHAAEHRRFWPRLVNSVFDALTLRRLSVGLFVVGVTATVLGLAGIAIDWMPNIAVDALALALAVGVIDRLARGDAEARIAPRFNLSMSRLGQMLRQYASELALDYGVTHAERKDLPNNTADLFDFWLAEQETEDRPRPSLVAWRNVAYPFLIAAGSDNAALVESHIAPDREILPPDLVAAADRLVDRMEASRQRYTFSTGPWHTSDVVRADIVTAATRDSVLAWQAFAEFVFHYAPLWSTVAPLTAETLTEQTTNARGV